MDKSDNDVSESFEDGEILKSACIFLDSMVDGIRMTGKVPPIHMFGLFVSYAVQFVRMAEANADTEEKKIEAQEFAIHYFSRLVKDKDYLQNLYQPASSKDGDNLSDEDKDKVIH